MPCDWLSPGSFACNIANTSCADMNSQFHLPLGSGFVLRGDQVAALEASGASVAILVEPTTILTIARDALNQTTATTATVTTTPRLVIGAGFTAADVAGAAVGVGLPLVIALLCMGIVIIRQRRRLRERQNTAGVGDNVDLDAYVRYQPAQAGVNSVMSPYRDTEQQYGRVQEMQNNHISEMSNE